MPEQTITTNLEFIAKDQASAQLERIDQNLKNIQQDADKTQKNVGNISESFTPLLRTGRELERAGMGLSRLGEFLGSNEIKRVGELTSGVGGLAMSLGEVQKVLQLIKSGGGIGTALGVLGAVAGGVTLGAGIYDATIGKAQGMDAGKIVKGAFASMGAELASELAPANERAKVYQQTLMDTAKVYGIIESDAQKAERENKASAEAFKEAMNAAGGFTLYIERLSAQMQKAAQQQPGTLQGAWSNLGATVLNATAQVSRQNDPRFQAAAKEFQDYQEKLRDAEKKAADDRAKIIADGQKQIGDLMRNYYREQARAAEELKKAQMKIVEGGVKEEAKAETDYYKQRSQAAAAFGIEMLRMEQDHQIAMQRMNQDHNLRIRRLAETRDALAIEDENQSYEINRSRAEQDYQKEAGRRNEDFARQMADMEGQFKEQRAARQQDRQQQLADLQTSFDEQQQQRREQLADEKQRIQEDSAARLAEIDKNLGEERRTLDDQFVQWRKEHGVFLEGEKQLWDDYLEYTYKALEQYIAKSASSDYGGGVSSHAEGGYQATTGLSKLHAGEFVLNPKTTQAAERMVNGTLTQEKVLASMGNASGTQSFTINQSFSGQESKPEVYRQIVYDTVTDLFRRARQ